MTRSECVTNDGLVTLRRYTGAAVAGLTAKQNGRGVIPTTIVDVTCGQAHSVAWFLICLFTYLLTLYVLTDLPSAAQRQRVLRDLERVKGRAGAARAACKMRLRNISKHGL